MDLLTESGTPADIEVLDRAWDAPRSFAFAAAVSSVDEAWWGRTLSHLPAAWHERHFALLTSGSTGQPKLVIGERSRTESLAAKIHRAQRLDAVRTAVLALPLSYSYSFINQWLWSRHAGVPLVHTRGLADPAGFLRQLRDAPDAMLCLVGSLVPLLRRVLPAQERFENVLRLNFAGGPFPQADLPWLRDVFPRALVFNNYGCTEALPRLAVRAADTSDEPACIGEPLPDIELRSDDEGALVFRSPHSAVGVATHEAAHAFAPDEWIATGDLAQQGPDGRWRLQGRANEVFKRHGEKVSLASLLEVVRASWGGQAAFYTEVAGNETAHVLALAPDPTAVEVREVLASLRRHFRRAHWPVRIEAVPRLALLANGKPDARAIAGDPARRIVWRQF